MTHFNFYCTVLLMTIHLTAGSARAADSSVVEGVVIENIGKGSALERAGVQPGDVLLSWEQQIGLEKQAGVIRNPFDWMWLKIERAPRATVQLIGQRDRQPISFLVHRGFGLAEIRPNLQDTALALYLFGNRLISSGEIDDGAFILEKLLLEHSNASHSFLPAWIHLRLATIAVTQQDWQEADVQYRLALLSAPSGAAEALIHLWIGDAYWDKESLILAEAAYCSALQSWTFTHNGDVGRAEIESALGRAAWDKGHLAQAEHYWSRALAIQSTLAPKSPQLAETLMNVGNIASAHGDLAYATENLNKSIEILEMAAPNSLGLANALDNLGTIMTEIGDYEEAKTILLRALQIRKTQAPGSLHVASSLIGLGNLESTVDLELAETYYRTALKIQSELAPNSFQTAAVLTNLASLLFDRGDVSTAQTYYEKAFQLQEQLAPESPNLALIISHQGNLHLYLGDIEAAESLFRKALVIQERAMPENLSITSTLSNLGNIAAQRNDLDTAGAYYNRALEIQEKLAPDSFYSAATLARIGDLAWEQGDIKRAAEYRLRALSIFRAINRNDLYTAVLLNNLGNMAWAQGNIEEALAYLNEALEIEMRWAPNGGDAAWTLQNLGYVARATGDMEDAVKYLEQALRIKEKLMPESWAEAEVLHELGSIHRDQKRPGLALTFFLRTLEAVESQAGKLGGTHDAKSSFRAKNQMYYKDAIHQLIEDGQIKKSFQVHESARARGLIAMLTERDIAQDQDIPTDLKDKRRSLHIQYDRTQQEILGSSQQQDSAHLERLLLDLRGIRSQIEETDSVIRRSSPRFATLRYPKIVDADGAAASLDPGTLMLSYNVGKDRTFLFIIARDRPLDLRILDLGEDELRRTVELFASLIRQSRSSKGIEFRWAKLEALAIDLFHKLIGPAIETVEKSERLLIVPDGPLHLLPWGALIRSMEGKGQEHVKQLQYLAEWKPIHTIISATAYSEIRKLNASGRSHSETSPLLIAFGDPAFPEDSTSWEPAFSDARVLSLAGRGFEFKPLPATRREVNEISRLYPRRTLTYLGREATEGHAKSIPRDSRIVHFATHGVIDEKFPFNSAVVLSIPERFEEGHDNGLLQAWEIIEQVRLDADLVVLSACETGLGKEMGGEGLIGLTRAFQYAGARSVMASLWKISDRTTAEFMVRFYRHLKEGLTKDEALRATQMEFIRGPIQVTNEKGERVDFDASAPYYWAAFQIYGDWQ